MWAIISGTGFEKFSLFETLETIEQETPFGQASSGIKRLKFLNQELIFIPRHGINHELLPSEINYCANIFLLKKLGVTKIFSLAAVGSLREALKPGELVIPTQYIDCTKGLRKHTFAGHGLVSHVSLAEPVTMSLFEALKKSQFDFPIHFGATCVTIEGPAYSTKAESNYYRMISADLIGMTSFPEYALAREAGLCFLPCYFVTDYDSWREGYPYVTTNMVLSMTEIVYQRVLNVIKIFVCNTLQDSSENCETLSMKNGLISNITMSDEQKIIMNLAGCTAEKSRCHDIN